MIEAPVKRSRVDDEVVLTQATQPRPDPTSKYRYAMICSSNINRSMEAHTVLQNEGFDVESYGVGKQLRLPGPDGRARCFDFGTPYADIAKALSEEGSAHYTRVGVLDLARRAAGTKKAPQRWQDAATIELERLNVVIVFEQRLFEATMLDLQQRDPVEFLPVHLICMDTRDSPKDAVEQGKKVLSLCRSIEGADLAVAMPPGVLESADRGEIQYMLAHI
jgi:RNA polymerase II subunit A C-terminal domain phosphatase SSU72